MGTYRFRFLSVSARHTPKKWGDFTSCSKMFQRHMVRRPVGQFLHPYPFVNMSSIHWRSFMQGGGKFILLEKLSAHVFLTSPQPETFPATRRATSSDLRIFLAMRSLLHDDEPMKRYLPHRTYLINAYPEH